MLEQAEVSVELHYNITRLRLRSKVSPQLTMLFLPLSLPNSIPRKNGGSVSQDIEFSNLAPSFPLLPLLQFFFFFFFFLGLHQQHVEVPSLKSNQSCCCWPMPQPQQHQIQAMSSTDTTVHGNAGYLTH